MLCKKCSAIIPDGSTYCNVCGKKQTTTERSSKKMRGNGQGSVYKLKNGRWRAAKTLGYYMDEAGKQHRIVVTKSTFRAKRDAANWIATAEEERRARLKEVTFKALYDLWLPTHKAGKSTLDCYRAAIKYFKPVWLSKMSDIDVDDLQECMDDCPKGKRTRENMKAVCGLIYKYGVPRKCVPDGLNLAKYLIVTGESGGSKHALEEADVEKVKNAIGIVPGADYVYCQIYLGFRPSEFLDLDAIRYNRKEKAFVGGAKTEAGTDRVVTVSPKIAPTINRLVADKISGPVFCDKNGERMPIKAYRSLFYDVLDAVGIDNPITEVDGNKTHKYTPHSCRHTFATLLKRVQGADKDKLELIGHSRGQRFDPAYLHQKVLISYEIRTFL